MRPQTKRTYDQEITSQIKCIVNLPLGKAIVNLCSAWQSKKHAQNAAAGKEI